MRIRFRPLHSRDRHIIERLHKEWFPVSYNKDFYNSIVVNKTLTGEPLFTCVVYIGKHKQQHSKGFFYKNSDIMVIEQCSIHDNYEAWSALATSMGIKTGYMDTLYRESFEIFTCSNVSTCRTNIHISKEENEEEVIGCLIGSIVDISSCKMEQVEVRVKKDMFSYIT